MFGKKKKVVDDVLTDEVTGGDTSGVTYSPKAEPVNVESGTTVDQTTIDNSPPPLGWKELKALRQNKYDEKSKQFDKAFVLKHKRSGMIVELRALSSVQACNFIGWRARQVSVIKVKDLADEKQAQDRIDNANAEIESTKENCPALQ